MEKNKGHKFKKGEHVSRETEFKPSHRLPKEARDKIGQANRKRVVSEETREKNRIALAKRGIIPRPVNYSHTEETKRKIGLGNKGKIRSKEQLEEFLNEG